MLREKSSLQTNDSLNATSSKAHVQAMLEGTHKTSHIHEKEEARIKKYESNAEVDNEDEGSQTNVHCEYCQNFCTCYIDRTKGKRKRSSSGGGSMRKQPRYMKMPDLQDAVVENFYRQGVQRCFDILKSAEEARAFSCCYIKQSQPNQEMVKVYRITKSCMIYCKFAEQKLLCVLDILSKYLFCAAFFWAAHLGQAVYLLYCMSKM